MSTQVCRVCITSNGRMHRIDTNRLQEMFEKVTNTKLHAGGRPVSICYICLSQLQKSQRFLEMCQRAEEMFADLITKGIEVEKHSIDMLNIGSMQHIALSVTSSQFENDYSINESSEVDVKEEPSGLEENATIVDIVKDEMDTEYFHIEESVLSNNRTMFVTLNESSPVAVKEEPSGIEENANIVDIVKDEMNTEYFLKEESVLSNNKTMFVTLNDSSPVAVKQEPSGIEENANIVDIVKDEMNTEYFQIEESILSNNTDNIESHYYCDVCNYKCTTRSGLVVHLKRHIVVNPYSCNRCNKNFTRRDTLSEHIRSHTGEKRYSCNECNKSFSQKSNLNDHIRTHTGEKPYACNECNKAFLRKSHLSQHIRTHTGEKPYSCNKCNKTFTRRHTLIEHIRSHTGEKPYSCNKCNKTFSQRGVLSVHIRTHSGVKPYACNKCNKTYYQKSHLRQHISRTHTGEKPYSCNKCHKSFLLKTDLSIHVRTHTGEKPYSCIECNKTFAQSGNLIQHIRTHTGEKPYSCIKCNKTFSQGGNLSRHIRTHIGE